MKITPHIYRLQIWLHLTLATLILAACSPQTTALSVVSDITEQTGQIELKDCEISIPNLPLRQKAQCGHLAVYENRDKQSGRQILLHVAVIKAVSRSPAPDPVFFIPGGPGEAASESFQTLSSAFDPINQKREIILVDQRGTGQSHKLQCQFNEEAESDDLQTLYHECLMKLDADTRFYTTSIAIEDLDDVRQALGYEVINIYGASYGTRVAQEYMRRFPDHTRSVILDGVVPMGWALGVDVAADAQRALSLTFERCQSNTACSKNFPDLQTEFDHLLDMLDTNSIEVPLDHPITGEPTTLTLDRDRFVNAIHVLTYAPETAALLPVMIHNAYAHNNFHRFAGIILSTEDSLTDSISAGMRMAVICSEDVPLFEQNKPSEGYMGSFMLDVFREICFIWPAGSVPSDYYQPVHSDIPVLLISGEVDPVTPPENGEQVLHYLSNGYHLIVPGMGHVNIHQGCIPQIAHQFIESGSVQGLDVTCSEKIQPPAFFVTLNGPLP